MKYLKFVQNVKVLIGIRQESLVRRNRKLHSKKSGSWHNFISE